MRRLKYLEGAVPPPSRPELTPCVFIFVLASRRACLCFVLSRASDAAHAVFHTSLGDSPPMDPEKALFVGAGLVMASYLRYVSGTIVDICWRLDIQCFRIKHGNKDE